MTYANIINGLGIGQLYRKLIEAIENRNQIQQAKHQAQQQQQQSTVDTGPESPYSYLLADQYTLKINECKVITYYGRWTYYEYF